MARHLRLHCRHAAGFGRLPEFLDKLTQVYADLDTEHQIGITFEVATTSTAPVLAAPVNVGACNDAGPSAGMRAAFEAAAPAGMGNDEIAVLFAASLTGASNFGCAQCPAGRRGVLVSATAPALTLPHEIAHLFLGSGHKPSSANLMFANVNGITENPPALSPDQVQTLRAGNWALPAADARGFDSVNVRAVRAPGHTTARNSTLKKATKRKVAAGYAAKTRRTSTRKQSPKPRSTSKTVKAARRAKMPRVKARRRGSKKR